MKICFLDKKSQEIYGEENYSLEEADRIVAMNPKSISDDMGDVFQFLVENSGKAFEFVETPYLNTENVIQYTNEAKDTREIDLYPKIIDILLDAYTLGIAGNSRVRSYITKCTYNKGVKMGFQPGRHIVTEKSIKLKPVILEKSKHFNGTTNNANLAKELGISINTLKRYIKQLKEETQQQK